jgi:dCMP deaminase
MLGPREDYLCWDDTWMTVAKAFAERSKDPSTQVGACIVDTNNHIAGLGYNGFPRDCDNYALPWDRVGDPLDTKYLYICHAESNAIDNGDAGKIPGSRIYVTLYPCNECAQRIIQNKIVEVIYLSDKYHDTDEATAARKMFKLAGVKTRQFKCEREEVIIDLRSP